MIRTSMRRSLVWAGVFTIFTTVFSAGAETSNQQDIGGGVEIYGIHLGMTDEEVIQELLRKHPSAIVEEKRGALAPLRRGGRATPISTTGALEIGRSPSARVPVGMRFIVTAATSDSYELHIEFLQDSRINYNEYRVSQLIWTHHFSGNFDAASFFLTKYGTKKFRYYKTGMGDASIKWDEMPRRDQEGRMGYSLIMQLSSSALNAIQLENHNYRKLQKVEERESRPPTADPF